MKMMIGRTLNAKMKPRSGIPSFAPISSIGPASQPKRNEEPLSAYPMAFETLFEKASSPSFPFSQ